MFVCVLSCYMLNVCVCCLVICQMFVCVVLLYVKCLWVLSCYMLNVCLLLCLVISGSCRDLEYPLWDVQLP